MSCAFSLFAAHKLPSYAALNFQSEVYVQSMVNLDAPVSFPFTGSSIEASLLAELIKVHHCSHSTPIFHPVSTCTVYSNGAQIRQTQSTEK